MAPLTAEVGDAGRAAPHHERLRFAIPYRCSAGSLDALRASARERGVTMSQLIGEALRAFGIPVLPADLDDAQNPQGWR
jgi:hypothetical protein